MKFTVVIHGIEAAAADVVEHVKDFVDDLRSHNHEIHQAHVNLENENGGGTVFLHPVPETPVDPVKTEPAGDLTGEPAKEAEEQGDHDTDPA